MLQFEQELGVPLTVAAVGDGSWDPRLGADPSVPTVSRASLLDDGRVLGGALEPPRNIAGISHNYDGELVARLDVLSVCIKQRLLYVFDSTSPIEASEHFRNCTTRARMRFECDGEMGTCLALENEQELIVYWWLHSHCGHLLERAVDVAAKSSLTEQRTAPIPYRPSRHVSIRGHAKGSERVSMLTCLNMNLTAHMILSSPSVVRASADQVDAHFATLEWQSPTSASYGVLGRTGSAYWAARCIPTPRAHGQISTLARCGVPVVCRSARL